MSDRIKITTAARLRELISTLERELGFDTLSANELNVLYVVRLLSDEAGTSAVESSRIRAHPIIQRMSQPTFNRAIRALLEKGYLETPPRYKAKRYRLGPKTAET